MEVHTRKNNHIQGYLTFGTKKIRYEWPFMSFIRLYTCLYIYAYIAIIYAFIVVLLVTSYNLINWIIIIYCMLSMHMSSPEGKASITL